MPEDYYPRIVEEVQARVYSSVVDGLPTNRPWPQNILSELATYVQEWIAKWDQSCVLCAYYDRRHLKNSADALKVQFVSEHF